MLKKPIVLAIAALAVTAAAIGGGALAQSPPPLNPPLTPSPVKRTPVGKIEVPGSNYEVITGMVKLVPGFKAGRHFHPGVVDAVVLDGEFWIAIDGQPEKTYSAGQSFEVPNRAIHNEGAVGDKPAKLIAVYVVEKGQPLVTPVK
jgi:quercetin dioxygenase-like cupin family protein